MRSLFLAIAATVASAAIVVRNTTYGMVQGTSENGLTTFRSIPFAAPPLGALRYAAPQPPVPWQGVRDASGEPNPCPQLKIDGNVYIGNEDCLYLQVYIPENAASTGPLPVLYWIFGGGYVLGDGEEFGFYDGSNLALKRGVIIVAVNYRVGPFGFLALSGLQSADPNNSTGNMGLQDQTLGLQWVKNNIAAFGGDPNRVTIFGESAGGFSVCWHMVNQASAGLFASAIMESGSCTSPQFFQPVDFAIAWNTQYAAAVGCNGSAATAGPAELGDDPTVSCMRSISTEDAMKSLLDMLNPNWPFTANSANPSPTFNMTHMFIHDVGMHPQLAPTSLPALAPIMPWGPAIDGSPAGLVDMPINLINAGQFNKVPMIMGTNANEGSIFIPAMPLVVRGTSFPPSDADLPAMLEHAMDMYNPAIVANVTNWVMQNYPPYPLNDNWARGADMLTHYFFSCGTRRTARALAEKGVPVYLYQFSHKLSFEAGLEYDLLGDYHVSELYFVWDNQWPPILHDFDANDVTISDAITAYWTNFAATANPNQGPASVGVQWPGYDPVGDLNIQLQVPVNVTQHLLQRLCDMWDGVEADLNSGGTTLPRKWMQPA
jgi:para-nitrobenzyl esterase